MAILWESELDNPWTDWLKFNVYDYIGSFTLYANFIKFGLGMLLSDMVKCTSCIGVLFFLIFIRYFLYTSEDKSTELL